VNKVASKNQGIISNTILLFSIFDPAALSDKVACPKITGRFLTLASSGGTPTPKVQVEKSAGSNDPSPPKWQVLAEAQKYRPCLQLPTAAACTRRGERERFAAERSLPQLPGYIRHGLGRCRRWFPVSLSLCVLQAVQCLNV
jgi:hypothetical protein